jgi:hypothetical protein
MPNSSSDTQRFEELKEAGRVIGTLAQDEAAFTRAAEAFRAQNAEAFQSELSKLDLLRRCHLICRWFCSKHCIFICSRLCREPFHPLEPSAQIKEMREFAQVTAHLTADDVLLRAFLAAVDSVDEKAFNDLLVKTKWQRFCHQICHFLCIVRCRLICELLCPPPPLITEVSFIPTSQIDNAGFGAGPSFGSAATPVDSKSAGVGDHPFGSSTNIRGVFEIANPFQYKVEFGPALVGPWTPITTPMQDFRFNPAFPPGPLFLNYVRIPDVNGWYNISDMGLAGFDNLTNWITTSVADAVYHLRLTVRNTLLAEFMSPLVLARIDNTAPTKPAITLQLQTPDGKRTKLGCCETVKQGNGNKVVITLQASDANFSSIGVSLLGGCGSGVGIVDVNGVALSKTYNGNTADTGYPVPTDFVWDPWAAKVDPCCYLIYVTINDRAILNDAWSGGHPSVNWQSITIA